MRVLINNPESGDESASERALELAADRGFDIRETEAAGHGIELAREAIRDGAELVVASGGDGTLNEVVRGVEAAGGLDEAALGVVPTGTGNDFAGNLGIPDVNAAFRALDDARERRIDLGTAVPLDGEGRPEPAEADEPTRFLNSCIGGLTAESSAATTTESKQRFGVLAYVLETVRETQNFEGMELDVRAGPERESVWSGEAAMLLVGNARRFPGSDESGGVQANVEDGLLDVVIVEHVPALNLANDAIATLLGREASHLTRLQTPELAVEAAESREFSLDGEFLPRRRLRIGVEPGAVRFVVGPEYEPASEV